MENTNRLLKYHLRICLHPELSYHTVLGLLYLKLAILIRRIELAVWLVLDAVTTDVDGQGKC